MKKELENKVEDDIKDQTKKKRKSRKSSFKTGLCASFEDPEMIKKPFSMWLKSKNLEDALVELTKAAEKDYDKFSGMHCIIANILGEFTVNVATEVVVNFK